MLYRRGNVWWYKFMFGGRLFQESSKTDSKDVARRAELKRRRQLEEGLHGLRKREAPQTLRSASDAWLQLKRPTLAPKSHRIEVTNLTHLLPVLGQRLISDIDAEAVSAYQQERLREGAAPKTVNLEVGTLRAILRRFRLWAELQPDVRMLPTPDDVGKVLSVAQEKRLLDACADSRSRSLLPAVTLALHTGMRYSEIRLLRWQQVDLRKRRVRVGKSKTLAGTGRSIPLNGRVAKVLKLWAEQFSSRRPEHCVFPSERYGAGGDDFKPCVHHVEPTRPINSWKEAWEFARKAAKVSIRFHDLRHTCVTRMLEGGVPLPVVASILGWSAGTTARMAKRYGHIGHTAQRDAVGVLEKSAKSGPRGGSRREGSGRPPE